MSNQNPPPSYWTHGNPRYNGDFCLFVSYYFKPKAAPQKINYDSDDESIMRKVSFKIRTRKALCLFHINGIIHSISTLNILLYSTNFSIQGGDSDDDNESVGSGFTSIAVEKPDNMMLPPSKPPLHPQAINPTAVEVVDISGDGDIAKVRTSTDVFLVQYFLLLKSFPKFEYVQNDYSLFLGIIYMHGIPTR